MKIIDKSVRDLKPYPQNAKKHDQRQIDNVANSIKRFGWQQPIVIDENDEVVIGHCRLLAAKQLGLDTVPVTVASDLTQDEIRELRTSTSVIEMIAAACDTPFLYLARRIRDT